MKKTIQINFLDMHEGFCAEDNIFINILRKRYNVEISDTPDYIFSMTFGEQYLDYDCVRIYWTGECQSPDFNLFDYAIAFDELEFGDRYLRMPYCYLRSEQTLKEAQEKSNIDKKAIEEKKEFANFVYSNAKADPYREELFEKLSQYKKILSGGRYKNNIGKPVSDKIEFLKQFKFTIACENASYPGYVTEKILEAFAAGTIPIYWGDPHVSHEFNEKAFINCKQFETIDEVIEEVKRIDQNDTLYMEMMREEAFIPGIVEKRKKDMEEFLFHIFDQNVEDAYRRNRGFWGKNYEGGKKQRRTIWNFYMRYGERLIRWKRKIVKLFR